MPRKRLVLPPTPIDVTCLNCDKAFTVDKTAKLFCSVVCRDRAKFVRYYRRCKRDGRFDRPDVRSAMQVRLGFALSDLGYDETARKLSPEIRAWVIERDQGKCVNCGKPGEEIDHIDGPNDALENLQFLCQSCHFEKTKTRMIELTPNHPQYAEKKLLAFNLMMRATAKKPLRNCDDDLSWSAQKYINARFADMQNARLLAQRELVMGRR
jgi:5-methylcytosine-specific restriction endonuclease McrA